MMRPIPLMNSLFKLIGSLYLTMALSALTATGQGLVSTEPQEALNVPPLPGAVDAAPEDALSGAIEITRELLISRPKSLRLKSQNLKKVGIEGHWKEGGHLLFRNVSVGDAVDIRIPASSPVAEQILLYATKSSAFGILRFSVNGQPAGEDIDCYADQHTPTGAIDLGTFDPVEGAYVLRVEVVGKNPNSYKTSFALDCVVLKEAK